MTNVKISIHSANENVEERLKFVDEWNIHPSLKTDLRQFVQDLGRGKVNKGVQIGKRTQVKYLSLLRHPLTLINKPLDKITKADVEKFDEVLSKGQSDKNKPFSAQSKKDLRVAFKVLLKWKRGESKALELTDFFDTRDVKKTPDYLKESEVEQLFKACKTNEERFIVAVLFDSGARAQEFLNIRLEDVQLPEGNNNFPRLTLKEEYSKTKGRVVSCYWAKSAEAINDYVRERVRDGLKNNEVLVFSTYDAIRAFLRRLGLKVLGKNIHPHLFRHSSATHYANRLNRHELCYRYGWAFSSDMPDVYISRSGMLNKDLDEKIENTSLGEMKARLSKEEYERKKLTEEITALKEFQSKMMTTLKQVLVLKQTDNLTEEEQAEVKRLSVIVD